MSCTCEFCEADPHETGPALVEARRFVASAISEREQYDRVVMALRDDRTAVRALVAALPVCSRLRDGAACREPATWASELLGSMCDEHGGEPDEFREERDYAPALRALLKRMEGWS